MRTIKSEIKWELLFSIMGLVWILLEKFSGLHSRYIDYQIYLTNLFAIPAILFMVLALKEKKEVFYFGKITYIQGLKSGIILSLMNALLSPLTQWITSYIISPEYFPNVIKRSVELDYYKTTAEAEANFNFPNYAIQGAISSFVMGMVTTAIGMVFIGSKQNSLHL